MHCRTFLNRLLMTYLQYIQPQIPSDKSWWYLTNYSYFSIMNTARFFSKLWRQTDNKWTSAVRKILRFRFFETFIEWPILTLMHENLPAIVSCAFLIDSKIFLWQLFTDTFGENLIVYSIIFKSCFVFWSLEMIWWFLSLSSS